ncbi:SIS domain-containing protein [Spelaeicoccus albus]
MPVFYEMGAELVKRGNINLGYRSLVFMPSVSGTTSEAIEALRHAENQGASVVTFTGNPDSPIATEADFNYAMSLDDSTSSEIFYLAFLVVAQAVVSASGSGRPFSTFAEEIEAVPSALMDIRDSYDDQALSVAHWLSRRDYVMFTGAGNVWPETHYYAMCILEEMQWIRTRPVHASDFFHGALELLEDDTPVVIMKGQDAARPIADRAENFAHRISSEVITLDSGAALVPSLSTEMQADVSPIVLATMLERVSSHLEVIRDHPLTTRRYYKVIDY